MSTGVSFFPTFRTCFQHTDSVTVREWDRNWNPTWVMSFGYGGMLSDLSRVLPVEKQLPISGGGTPEIGRRDEKLPWFRTGGASLGRVAPWMPTQPEAWPGARRIWSNP